MRNFEMNKLLVLTLGVFVAACSERPTEPQALSPPRLAKGASGTAQRGGTPPARPLPTSS